MGYWSLETDNGAESSAVRWLSANIRAEHENELLHQRCAELLGFGKLHIAKKQHFGQETSPKAAPELLCGHQLGFRVCWLGIYNAGVEKKKTHFSVLVFSCRGVFENWRRRGGDRFWRFS